MAPRARKVQRRPRDFCVSLNFVLSSQDFQSKTTERGHRWTASHPGARFGDSSLAPRPQRSLLGYGRCDRGYARCGPRMRTMWSENRF
eukprot:scaffold468_cov216-Pinguiococcus_pyrenoidosus.AAC.5